MSDRATGPDSSSYKRCFSELGARCSRVPRCGGVYLDAIGALGREGYRNSDELFGLCGKRAVFEYGFVERPERFYGFGRKLFEFLQAIQVVHIKHGEFLE
jgi:hypothetical protein